MVAYEWQRENPTTESILKCQDKMCELITKLGDEGEIYISQLLYFPEKE